MALRNNKDDNVLICTAYPYTRYGYAEPDSNINNTVCFQSNNLNFTCTTSSFTSLEEWREYLGKNKVSLIYAVSEPIETQLSAEELEAYAALRTYDGTTVVATDAPVAGLSARYVADGAAYIDSKIQAALNPVNQTILEAKTNV